jgi:hypothetical protein
VLQVLEDADSAIHMRNLSCHLAGTEEDALNLVSPEFAFAARASSI